MTVTRDLARHRGRAPAGASGFTRCARFADHGATGTGGPLAIPLWPGNARANSVADRITLAKDALWQVSGGTGYRVGRRVLVRTDGGGRGDFLTYVHKRWVS